VYLHCRNGGYRFPTTWLFHHQQPKRLQPLAVRWKHDGYNWLID
jgi:hypothetical protein